MAVAADVGGSGVVSDATIDATFAAEDDAVVVVVVVAVDDDDDPDENVSDGAADDDGEMALAAGNARLKGVAAAAWTPPKNCPAPSPPIT